MSEAIASVLSEVFAERKAQDARFGEQNHDPAVYLSILVEEVGEVAQDINDATHGDEDSPRVCLLAARAELVQVAAVAVAMIEALDRRLA